MKTIEETQADHAAYVKKISDIKTDLSTSALTQIQIAKKHDVTPGFVCNLNRGNIYPTIGPITPKQLSRQMEMERRKQLAADKPEQKEAERPLWVTAKLPRTIIFQITTNEQAEWLMSVLKEREKHLMLQLAKTTIMANALETNDFSMVSDSLREEMDRDIESVMMKKKAS